MVYDKGNMTPKNQRRRHPRFEVERLPGVLVLPRGGEVLNISVSGIGVRTPAPLRIGKQLKFKLGGGPTDIDLTGVVQWCHLAGRRQHEDGSSELVYEAGIAFDPGVSEQIRDTLTFLGSDPVVVPERRFHGRYVLDDPAPLTVEMEHDLHVRLISLSGMLAETDVSVPSETRVQLSLALDGSTFESRARVAMTEERVESEQHFIAVGLEFIETPPEQESVLRRFIESHVVLDAPDPDAG